MARQPVRMIGPGTAGINTAAGMRYTAPSYVPTTLRSVVRHIHVSNPAGSAITVSVGIAGSAAINRVFDGYSIAASAVLDHYCQYPLASGETVDAWTNAQGVPVVTISGDENM